MGDTTENENVNASDVSLVKLQSGQVIDADNFRSDIIANGVINASDISAAKSKSGSAAVGGIDAADILASGGQKYRGGWAAGNYSLGSQ
jgi:hypothetical protein